MSRVLAVLTKLGLEVKDPGGERRAYGPCPFHEEKGKHDNWFIRLRGERRGQYHCFVCKEKGGLSDLVSHVRGCSRDGARDWLERFKEVADEPVKTYLSVRMEVAETGRREFRMPKEVRFGPLDEWVTPARRYAEERRHIPDWQVLLWGLGYAITGKLAGRIVLPVRATRDGAPVSYMARTFADHALRYLYPAEREHPDLDVIFGEQFWPRDRRDRTVVITEGALNGLAVQRAVGGAVHLGALGGSDPRPMHVGKLSTFGLCVVLTDDDVAGRGAAWELSCQLQRHTKVVRVSLGEGRDADDVTPEELRSVIEPCMSGGKKVEPATRIGGGVGVSSAR